MTSPLVFIMGVQRSGTNALFRSLSGGAAQAYNEAHSSPLFESMYLRPEPQVRQTIAAAGGPVLAKPISETKRRSVRDVFREYARYDLRVAWIYRDPVNCYASHINRWDEYKGRAEAFVQSWCQRNQMALDGLEDAGGRLAIVRYRDLIDDHRLIKQLGDFLGLRGRYRFRSDSDVGRGVLPDSVVDVVTQATRSVWDQLQSARTFEVTPSSSWRRGLARIA